MHGEYKVPGGKLVVVDFEASDGLIQNFSLSGDFFLEPDTTLGLINQALATFGIHGPAWLTDTSWALFSVALMDQICPPSTVFGAYNAWASDDKQILHYAYNGHEGGGPHHRRAQLDWLADRVG